MRGQTNQNKGKKMSQCKYTKQRIVYSIYNEDGDFQQHLLPKELGGGVRHYLKFNKSVKIERESISQAHFERIFGDY